MKKNLAWAAAMGLAACVSLPASAATTNLSFAGSGISASLQITYGTATDAKYPQALEITGISGTFSDSNIGITNASVLGLVQVNHSTPEATNKLAPIDFSRLAVATGLPMESHGFLTYDNLYWPGGSLPTSTDYQAAGGVFDIYGVMFRIGNGRVVDLWSNGIFGAPGSSPVTYGVGVATIDASLDYVARDVALVPEPGSMALMLGGLGVVGLVARRRLGR